MLHWPHPPTPHRRERQLAEAAYRFKRSGSTAYSHDCCHSDSSDDDQPDGHFTQDHTPKQNKRELTTPKSDKKRLFKRKRRSVAASNARHVSLPEGQSFLERITNRDSLARRQSFPPLQSIPPTPPPHTSHTPTHNILTPPSPEKSPFQLDLRPQDGPEEHGSIVITPGGTLSPGVTDLLERVPSLRRTESNSSARGRKRRSNSGSPLSLSPVKRQVSGVGLHSNCPHSNCPLPSAASSSRRASNKSTPSHDSSNPYTKLDTSDSSSSETDNTRSSAIAGNITTTTSNYDDEQPIRTPRQRNSNTLHDNENIDATTNVESSLRSVYSNESSVDTRGSDGGNDADSESNNSDDPISEIETFDNNDTTSSVQSPSPSSVRGDSDDLVPYTHCMSYGIETSDNLIPEPNSTRSTPIMDPEISINSSIFSHPFFDRPSSSTMPTSTTEFKGHSGEVPELPLHMERPMRREQISATYSPKLAEEVWRRSNIVCT